MNHRLAVICLATALSGLNFFACSENGSEKPSEAKTPACEKLFGLPNQNSGVDESLCEPQCSTCANETTFRYQDYTSNDLSQLRGATLLNPGELLQEDPFANPENFPREEEKFCAILVQTEDSYELKTFDSEEEAKLAGAQITHHGACGACSSLQDLATYIEWDDLTGPVRQCGITNFGGSIAEIAECISALGFTPICSEIWAYNTQHTRNVCLQECLDALDAPYLLEDGSLNPCIQCDEEKSGPVFKAVSGRTRRNSGLPTALCRPCESIAPVHHVYEFSD
ncbi:MAG: hypothetical protein MK135_02715 [Polyangiaceae bacterium]|nr:hypothetical protein [Polyangiaceae bacterium]